MKKRRCEKCGVDISDTPSHYFLCYSCWKASHSFSHSKEENDLKSDFYDENRGPSDAELARFQKEEGFSDEDMADGAWLDYF